MEPIEAQQQFLAIILCAVTVKLKRAKLNNQRASWTVLEIRANEYVKKDPSLRESLRTSASNTFKINV